METREIKFRAWIKSKQFGQEMFNVIMISMGRDEMILSGKGGTVSGKDCVLMQFTGLKDKNGTDIYEGDIIGTSDQYKPTFVVKFGEYSDCVEEYGYDGCGWYLEMGKEQTSLARMSHINSSGFEVRDCVIIGNIHQNPELL